MMQQLSSNLLMINSFETMCYFCSFWYQLIFVYTHQHDFHFLYFSFFLLFRSFVLGHVNKFVNIFHLWFQSLYDSFVLFCSIFKMSHQFNSLFFLQNTCHSFLHYLSSIQYLCYSTMGHLNIYKALLWLFDCFVIFNSHYVHFKAKAN